jgi:hypothetical protein
MGWELDSTIKGYIKGGNSLERCIFTIIILGASYYFHASSLLQAACSLAEKSGAPSPYPSLVTLTFTTIPPLFSHHKHLPYPTKTAYIFLINFQKSLSRIKNKVKLKHQSKCVLKSSSLPCWQPRTSSSRDLHPVKRPTMSLLQPSSRLVLIPPSSKRSFPSKSTFSLHVSRTIPKAARSPLSAYSQTALPTSTRTLSSVELTKIQPALFQDQHLSTLRLRH